MLRCHPQSRTITLHLNDQSSYDLGSYWNRTEHRIKSVVDRTQLTNSQVVEGAEVYLARALGRDQFLAEQACVTAFNWGLCLVDVPTKHVTPIDPTSAPERETILSKKLNDVLERDPTALPEPVVFVERDIDRTVDTKLKKRVPQ